MANASSAEAWSDQLWREAERQAHGLDGAAVVRALAEASSAVWGCGLDRAFHRMRAARGDRGLSLDTASAFDVTWLSVFIVKLAAATREYTEPEKRHAR